MTLPKLLDDLVSQRIIEAVRAGASRTAAAEAARVGRSTLHLWLRRGGDGEEPYASFAMKVREAEGELERELVTIIKRHAIDTWTCAAWLLERKFQRRWALRRHAPEQLAPMSEDEADKLLADAAAMHAKREGAK